MAWGRLCAAVGSLLVAACSSAPRERITLGTGHWPAYGLVFIAEANGYFAARGLSVEQRRFATGRDTIAALAAGELDAATSFETPVAIRAARDRLEVLTTLQTSTRSAVVVARADRGIARTEDLAGKRIGVSRGTSLEYFLHTVLASAAVEREAEIVDVGPQDAVQALVRGDVDAIATAPPYTAHARSALGAAAIVELGSETYAEIAVLTVRAETHQRRGAALVKLVAALADAERLVRERPERAFAAVRAEFPEVGEAELREAWDRIAPSLGVTHELAAVLEREESWFRRRGRVEGPPLDVGAVLEPGVLNEVDPEAVTFVSPARVDRTGGR